MEEIDIRKKSTMSTFSVDLLLTLLTSLSSACCPCDQKVEVAVQTAWALASQTPTARTMDPLSAVTTLLTICVKIHEAAKQAKENEASFQPAPGTLLNEREQGNVCVPDVSP